MQFEVRTAAQEVFANHEEVSAEYIDRMATILVTALICFGFEESRVECAQTYCVAGADELALLDITARVEGRGTMLDVVNVSTGANTASQDKFPNRVLTGTFDAGFYAELLNKDVQLYIANVRNAKTPSDVGETVSSIWQQGTDHFEPKTDFTNIFKFIRDHRGNE